MHDSPGRKLLLIDVRLDEQAQQHEWKITAGNAHINNEDGVELTEVHAGAVSCWYHYAQTVETLLLANNMLRLI